MSPTSSGIDSIFLISIATYLCVCLLAVIFFLFVALFFYYLIRKSRIEAKNEYIQDFFAKVWFRTFLITPKGVFVLVMSLIALIISFSSVQFSVISTLAFFFIIILAVTYAYAQFVNILLFILQKVFRRQLVSSFLNFNEIYAGDYVRKEVRLKIPFPPGFVIRMSVFIPPKLGEEIRNAAGVKDNSFINFSVVLPKSKRGNFKIGPVIIEYEDILGFTRIQLVDSKLNNLKILPTVDRITKLNWTAVSKKHGDDAVVKRVLNNEDFFDLREYKRGDDLKRIHWKVSAKANKFMVRMPEITNVRIGNMKVFIDNVMPGDIESGVILKNYHGSQDILDKIIETASSISDFVLNYGSEVEIYYLLTNKKVKKLTVKGKRREEWLEKLIDIDWVRDVNKKEISIQQLLDDAADSSGIFFITSEISSKRIAALTSDNKASKQLNLVFIEPSSFLKVNKNVPAKIIEKIFLTAPYLEQFSALESFLTPKRVSFDYINKDLLLKINKASRKAVALFRSSFPSFKFIDNSSNISEVLEK